MVEGALCPITLCLLTPHCTRSFIASWLPDIINANLKYIDNNRKQLKKQFAAFGDFNARYEVPQSFVDDVLQMAAKDKIKPKDDKELQATLPQLRRQLKALVARDLWDMSEYFQVINETNPIVEKAVELMK